MSDVLEKIYKHKKEHIIKRKKKLSEKSLIEKAFNCGPTRGFASSLTKKIDSGSPALITEIKKASPSGGIIRENFNPKLIAKSYYNAGATCISVLTDTPFFQGKDFYIKQVKETVPIPVLRKDFIIDKYQIYESKYIGADCILLIMALLETNEAKEFSSIAHSLGLDVLIEVHNKKELEEALKIPSHLLGINNRNLKNLEIDIATTEKLIKDIPDNRDIISESGFSSHEEINYIIEKGVFRFLIGEHLMKQENIEEATLSLVQNTLIKNNLKN